MYCVIQLDDSGSNGLAVVHSSWLTPMKKEVFWPPYKETVKFKRALVEGEDVDVEKWKIYGVDRIFYQTDQLDTAYRKEKEAELTSDLADSDAGSKVIVRQQRRRLPKRFILESDSDDNDTTYSRPPQIKIQKLSDVVETRELSQRGAQSSQCNSSQRGAQSSQCNSDFPITSSSPAQPALSCRVEFQEPLKDQTNKTFVNLLNQIKEQNKIIISKLDEVLKNGQGYASTNEDIKDHLPVHLPLTTKEELGTLEKYARSEENFNLLVVYLRSLGGKNIKSKIHTILRKIFEDKLASKFSYFGKRGKEPFYDLIINKALTRAVQTNNENITVVEIEEITKLWIKHAPDRVRSKNKLAQHHE